MCAYCYAKNNGRVDERRVRLYEKKKTKKNRKTVRPKEKKKKPHVFWEKFYSAVRPRVGDIN